MQARYPERTIRLNGLEWRVRETGGPGPVLLLLPGGLGNADIFYRQMLGLAPNVRCIAVDYPDAGFEEMAKGLVSLLDALGLDRAHLLGSSLAGYLLQVFGARYAERIDALILANSFCGSTELRQHPLFSISILEAVTGDDLKDEWLARLEARALDELRDVQAALLREGQAGELLRRRLLAAATAPLAPVMVRGRFPIFILDCADDPILSAPIRTALAERYPEAVRLTLPTGGHYPSVAQMEAYNRFILSAIAGDEAGTVPSIEQTRGAR